MVASRDARRNKRSVAGGRDAPKGESAIRKIRFRAQFFDGSPRNDNHAPCRSGGHSAGRQLVCHEFLPGFAVARSHTYRPTGTSHDTTPVDSPRLSAHHRTACVTFITTIANNLRCHVQARWSPPHRVAASREGVLLRHDLDGHKHVRDSVQQVHPGVQRVPVPDRADAVAHGVLHVRFVILSERDWRHQAPAMPRKEYVNRVVPIGALYAASLWLSNSAYLHLSVSFIQMTKALMPGLVYVVGVGLGMEKLTKLTSVNMVIIAVGVAIAAYGEIDFVWLGVVEQLSALVFEAVRLMLVQVLITRQGYAMNPIQSLYYVSPACGVCLLLPFIFVELPEILADTTLQIDYPMLSLNALTAFALNLAVFLLIGKTSALTMNIAGVIKDWVLIFASQHLFGNKGTFVFTKSKHTLFTDPL